MDIFESFAAAQGEQRQRRMMSVCSEGAEKPLGEEGRCQPVCRGQGAFSRLRPHSRALPGGLWARTAWAGLLPLRDVPRDPEAVTPYPGTTVLWPKWLLQLALAWDFIFLSKALNVLTPILAHLPADSGGSSS